MFFKNNKLVILMCLLYMSATTLAQEVKVESFIEDLSDLSAVANETLDANGKSCALLKIMILDKSVSFKSDWIIKSEEKGQSEYWVWLCEGTSSIIIKSDDFIPFEVVFAEHNPDVKNLKSKHTYVLVLNVDKADATVDVRFVCNVSEVQYFIDGNPTVLGQNEYKLTIGNHKVRAEADKYEPYEHEVEISPYMTYQEIHIQLVYEITDKELQYKQGLHYDSSGMYQDAIRLFRKSAAQGYAPAQYLMGRMYYLGHGVTKDYKETIKWYKNAVDQGYAPAQNSYGFMYERGYGVARNNQEAVKWYRASAEQGWDIAQFNLGIKYQYGDGVEKNITEAVKWYTLAAEQNYADAQCNLGYLYNEGKGVKQDYVEAVKWFRAAAEQGHALSQYNLGLNYAHGEGVVFLISLFVTAMVITDCMPLPLAA